MPTDRTAEILLEVRKLQELIEECCPEVFNERLQDIGPAHDPNSGLEALNRHRKSILEEAAGKHKKA